VVSLALSAKVAHQRVHGGSAVAELLGDLSRRDAFHKEGTQEFIAAVQGVAGLAEELEATCVIHDGTPKLG